jgi:putative hydrolase of the HAD superfamily
VTSAPAPPSAIDLRYCDALIFDLGGVILSLHPERTVEQMSLLYDRDARAAYTQAKQHAIFDEFERGELDEDAFRARVGKLFDAGVSIDAQRFDDAWSAMLGRIPEETLRLLYHLSKVCRLFLLSNTNTIHIERFLRDYRERHEAAHGPWSALFEVAYYSHELGMRKPEQRIFSEVLQRHDLDPDRTLFIDDHLGNIEGALLAGLRAEHHPTNASLAARFAAFVTNEDDHV